MHAIPLLLADPPASENINNVGLYDLMAAAQTGSGKTLAYLLPILQRIMCTYPSDSMTALVGLLFQFMPTKGFLVKLPTLGFHIMFLTISVFHPS